MLTSSFGGSTEVEKIIKELIREEFAFEQTCRRSVAREHFVRPVSVQIPDNSPFLTFSKNFSSQGIGLIGNCSVDEGQRAELSVYRLKNKPVVISAECRWCRKYGDTWYLTGWRFERPAK